MYTDLLLKPEEDEEAIRIFKIARRMGYRIIGLTSDKNLCRENRIVEEASRLGLKILRVVEIETGNEASARKLVRKTYDGNKILIGIPKSPSALRFFSRDTRVKVVEIPPKLTKLLDRNQAKLMLQGESLIGIRLSRIADKIKLIPWMDKILSFSVRYGVDTVLYSGAREWNMLWHPKTIISLISMLGYPKDFAKTVITPYIAGVSIG